MHSEVPWSKVGAATAIGVVTVVASVACFVWYVLPTDGTVYASNYSEAKFLKLKRGMSSDAVLDLLGEPLSVELLGSATNTIRNHQTVQSASEFLKTSDAADVTEVLWKYTDHKPLLESFNIRWVAFSPDMRVKELDHEYWMD